MNPGVFFGIPILDEEVGYLHRHLESARRALRGSRSESGATRPPDPNRARREMETLSEQFQMHAHSEEARMQTVYFPSRQAHHEEHIRLGAALQRVAAQPTLADVDGLAVAINTHARQWDLPYYQWLAEEETER